MTVPRGPLPRPGGTVAEQERRTTRQQMKGAAAVAAAAAAAAGAVVRSSRAVLAPAPSRQRRVALAGRASVDTGQSERNTQVRARVGLAASWWDGGGGGDGAVVAVVGAEGRGGAGAGGAGAARTRLASRVPRKRWWW